MTEQNWRESPYRICLVCTGNICRSPMAEVVLKAKAEDKGIGELIRVDSAGTSGWHAGEGMDPGAIGALAARGYDGSGHVARQFDPKWIADRELIVALDRSHLRVISNEATRSSRGRIALLRSFDPSAHGALDVPDPYGGSHQEFERCLDMIERSCDGITAYLGEYLDP